MGPETGVGGDELAPQHVVISSQCLRCSQAVSSRSVQSVFVARLGRRQLHRAQRRRRKQLQLQLWYRWSIAVPEARRRVTVVVARACGVVDAMLGLDDSARATQPFAQLVRIITAGTRWHGGVLHHANPGGREGPSFVLRRHTNLAYTATSAPLRSASCLPIRVRATDRFPVRNEPERVERATDGGERYRDLARCVLRSRRRRVSTKLGVRRRRWHRELGTRMSNELGTRNSAHPLSQQRDIGRCRERRCPRRLITGTSRSECSPSTSASPPRPGRAPPNVTLNALACGP